MAQPSAEVLQAIATQTDPSVPHEIVLAIAEHETGFDPTATGAAGEIGLMQLLPDTVRTELNYQGPLEALYDPNVNVALGSQYLKILFARWHTWPEAIRAWNGSGSAARAYAAAVWQQVSKWGQFVANNLKFFQTAAGKRAVSWGLVLAGALVLLLVLSRRRRGRLTA